MFFEKENVKSKIFINSDPEMVGRRIADFINKLIEQKANYKIIDLEVCNF